MNNARNTRNADGESLFSSHLSGNTDQPVSMNSEDLFAGSWDVEDTSFDTSGSAGSKGQFVELSANTSKDGSDAIDSGMNSEDLFAGSWDVEDTSFDTSGSAGSKGQFVELKPKNPQ